MSDKQKKSLRDFKISDGYDFRDEPSYHSVDRPLHYSSGHIECIDAMQSAFGKESMEVYCRVNAFKYVWRAGDKGDASTEKEDIKKAIWYLKMSIGDDPRA